MVLVCTKFQVCVVFRLARRRDTNTYTNTHIHKYTHIQVKIGISSPGCSPHAHLDKVINLRRSLPEVVQI